VRQVIQLGQAGSKEDIQAYRKRLLTPLKTLAHVQRLQCNLAFNLRVAAQPRTGRLQPWIWMPARAPYLPKQADVRAGSIGRSDSTASPASLTDQARVGRHGRTRANWPSIAGDAAGPQPPGAIVGQAPACRREVPFFIHSLVPAVIR
jgi:hypothetical protein